MRSLLCSLLLLAAASDAQAQSSDTGFTLHLKPQLDVHRRAGDIHIDGSLDDEGWKSAARSSDFTAVLPIPNSRPKEKTEAYVTYDDDYFYVAMIGYDHDPSAIRASKAARDQIWDDDFMGIILDTYGDATRSFEIYLNPYGIQGDLFWTSTSEDGGYDMIWDGESKITATGWQMEMRIPFRSLRFPAREMQNFHITFWRNYPRESDYKFSWAPINFQVPCAFCQLGSLTGISGVHNAGRFELLPAVVTSQSAALETNPLGERLINHDVVVKPSLTARMALGTATALEAAIKPDFSQVESDAAQVSANAKFALYYPERRPFFQDGSDLWNTYLNAVYTRSINSPIAAIKALHRDDVSSYAFLSSYDDNTPIILPLEESSVTVFDDHKSLSNIFRATRTIGDDRYIGLLATDRRYTANGSNTILGIDTRMRLFENVAFYGQQLFSLTREEDTSIFPDTARFDHGAHTLTFNGEHFNGNSNILALERMTTGWDIHMEYGQTSPSFRAGDGFITQNSIHNASGWTGYKYILEDAPSWLKWLVEIDGSLVYWNSWNYDGDTKGTLVRPGLDLSIVGQTNVHVKYQKATERFAGVDFRDLYNVNVFGNTKFMQGLSISWNVRRGRAIYYDTASPAMGKEWNAVFSAQFRPFDAVTIEPAYTYSRLDSMNGTGSFYAGSIYWTKLGYQFNREFDLRIIAQYDGFRQQMIVDPLLTYKLNPFTSVYVGSAHSFLGQDGSNFQSTERQFFAKLQYLIQA